MKSNTHVNGYYINGISDTEIELETKLIENSLGKVKVKMPKLNSETLEYVLSNLRLSKEGLAAKTDKELLNHSPALKD